MRDVASAVILAPPFLGRDRHEQLLVALLYNSIVCRLSYGTGAAAPSGVLKLPFRFVFSLCRPMGLWSPPARQRHGFRRGGRCSSDTRDGVGVVASYDKHSWQHSRAFRIHDFALLFSFCLICLHLRVDLCDLVRTRAYVKRGAERYGYWYRCCRP